MVNPNSSFPVFIVQHLGNAKEFYTGYFGFNIAFKNAWYLHLVSESGVQVGFMLPNQPSQPEIFHKSFSGKGVIFSLEVDDVDDAYSQVQAKNLNIVLRLRSEDWGQRHFSVEDPNGVYLDVVQAVEPTGEYQSDYAI
ncbi:hypothetical protein D3OALGA1CA_435 [Olavius algarvensis associated proteobacterium Delta 3]|nr:hypothetical protein D3OALGB2SA_502 [Olavius algarvensis associated proteobacterium Delta 3]CAB5084304.1 hypothetical protein D3OALGA1CA_435 [Olavius algarvensis associated proteobacterium Delta 3]